VKLAVIEAEWETQKAPGSFTAFGIPNDETQRTDYAIQIPWLLGLMATRSMTTEVTGIKNLKEEHLQRIESGSVAYAQLQKLRAGDNSAETRALFEKHKDDLGFGLLLKKYTANVVDATPEQKRAAADDTIPKIEPMFWSFRLMVGWECGSCSYSRVVLSWRSAIWQSARRLLLRLALYSIPLPWIACELGWFVAEYGRQP
jgi:cytochrome d ubiquinol oxidase subunit I